LDQIKPNVFVSSTYEDLRDHREAVRDAIRQLGAIDISMEHFGARDARPKDECLRLISEESDCFVGIYAHRYGKCQKGTPMSITEAEYIKAREIKLPRFVYMVDEDAPWNPKHIDVGASKKLLLKFKNGIKSELIVRHFDTKYRLAANVAADLGRHFATEKLMRVEPSVDAYKNNTRLATSKEWNKCRDGVYKNNQGLFLIHNLSPSMKPGQLYDIFIFLRKHRTDDLSDVEYAEFFLGPYWGNRVFKVINQGELVGLWTSAYGEFLCVCLVKLKNGSHVMLSRYIDFGSYWSPDIPA